MLLGKNSATDVDIQSSWFQDHNISTSNANLKIIMKLVRFLKNSCILIKYVTKLIKNKNKEQAVGFN